MSKIINNPNMKGLSGMLGNVVVFRESRGQLQMCNRPKRRIGTSQTQQAVIDKFAEAVAFAKGQMSDPVGKAEYQAMVGVRFSSAYGAAVADCLSGPRIVNIDTTVYNGAINEKITVKAVDNVRVAEVFVELRSATDVLIEKGFAVKDPLNELLWVYAATVANAVLSGTKVIVTAKDKPNNQAVQEVVMA
jgi:hypothetical protein